MLVPRDDDCGYVARRTWLVNRSGVTTGVKLSSIVTRRKGACRELSASGDPGLPQAPRTWSEGALLPTISRSEGTLFVSTLSNESFGIDFYLTRL